MYDNKTYEFAVIQLGEDLTIIVDATNSGSISDAAVRNVMTLYADGEAFALGDANYVPQPDGSTYLIWQNAGLTWAAGDTVQLEMRVSE